MSVITAWSDFTLGSESTEPLETARHRRYVLDPPPTQDSHPWVALMPPAVPSCLSPPLRAPFPNLPELD